MKRKLTKFFNLVKNIKEIKVMLIFNMTTNSGTSDDIILHLQAGKIEVFNIELINLNKTEVKYELIYDVCSDSKCTSVSKEMPNDIGIYKETDGTEINENITSKDAKTII